MSEPLTKAEIDLALQKLPEWETDANHLCKTYTFEGFAQAIAFIVEVGYAAEAANHHPEIYNVYSKVMLSLTTHDAGDVITHKDLVLAQKIEAIFNRKA